MKIKKWTVVFTGDIDPMWPFLVQECTASEVRSIILYPTNQPHRAHCSIIPDKNEFILQIDNLKIHSHQIRSIWWRRNVPYHNDSFNHQLMQYCHDEYHCFHENIEGCDSDHIRWVSHPSAINSARNKAKQLRIAHQIGFATPRTIFTNNPKQFADCFESRDYIYKSINTPRTFTADGRKATVYTTDLGIESQPDFNSIISCPGILQKKIEKKFDIRVTVFGKECHAVSIDSQSKPETRIDFRKISSQLLPHQIFKLPTLIQKRCIKIVHELGLEYGAIDLILSKDMEFYFLEINPNGQWGWLEMITGIRLRRSLLNLLFKPNQ